MSLAKAKAKINNIVHRTVPYGKKDVLQLVDRNTREILADIDLWSWQRLNPTVPGAPTFKFRLTANNETKDLLQSCDIAFNGMVHDVIVRDAPESVTGIEWTLRTSPTNEQV
jgi:hypothetical protein